MPQGTTRIDKALTNLSIQYRNTEAIYPGLLPEINVVQDGGQFWVYNRDIKLPDTGRANKAPANMVTWSGSFSSYNIQEHGLKDLVSDNDKENAESVMDLNKDTMEFLADKMVQRQEFDTAQILFTTSSFSNNQALNTASSWRENTTTSNPVGNILSATSVIVQSAGVKPNVLVMGLAEMHDLRENTQLHERVKYVKESIMTEQILASLFDIGSVMVGSMVRDSGQEGLASSNGYIWNTHALLGFFGGTGLRTKSTAVMIRNARHGKPFRVKRWREEELSGDYIEVGTKMRPRVVATNSAFLFTSITST